MAPVACSNCARGEDEKSKEVEEIGESVEEEVIEDRSTQKSTRRMKVLLVRCDSRK